MRPPNRLSTESHTASEQRGRASRAGGPTLGSALEPAASPAWHFSAAAPNSPVSTLSCILCTLQDTLGQVHVCPYPSTARLQDRDVALLQGAPGCTGTLTSDRLSFKCFVSHRECGDTQQCQKLPETRTPTAYLFIGWAVTEACGRPGTRRRASFLHTAGRGLRAGLTLACNAPC